MIHDAGEWSGDVELRADICIVGAGAAGITLARELEGHGLRVILLESGGRTFRRDVQRLYAGENAGRPSHSTYASRVRMFGGSTTRWSGMCRPLARSDFERRSWIPHSGWPFGLEELDPYYRRAHVVCGLGPCNYLPGHWDSADRPLLPLDWERIRAEMYQFAHPLDFGVVYGEELARSRDVHVHLGANVVGLAVDPDVRKVTGVRVLTARGKRARVIADRVVLACGGLENPRLLLASNERLPAGLGNRHDLVGRFFMDHVFLFQGAVELSHPGRMRNLHVIEDYERTGRDQPSVATLALPEEVLQTEGLTRCVAFLVARPGHKTRPAYFSRGRQALNALAERMRGTDMPDRPVSQMIGEVLTDLPEVSRALLGEAAERIRPRPRLGLRVMVETTPNPESRVTLGPQRDRLGMPRIRVDWRLNPDDSRSLLRTTEVLDEELARANVGRLVDALPLHAEGWPVSASGGMHHMGTTRMHEDPRQGVVNPDGRLHELSNLFVAGSSVFPTGGVANPTLTIVALAIRLADHLKGLPYLRRTDPEAGEGT